MAAGQVHKIGFWSLFSIVVGSQVGSGILALPANLAPYGVHAFIGWILAAGGAIILALIFALLCAKFPKTGGPHVYVKQAFGDSWAFFAGWTYWVISWVSTTAVVITSVGYLGPFIAPYGEVGYLAAEVLLVALLTLLNLKGVEASGRAEFVLTALKIIPLLIVPVVALFFFDASNITVDEHLEQSMTLSSMFGQIMLITLWGFIGLECATAPAEFVDNPQKTVPKAILYGTIFVAFIYFINCLGIMGIIPGSELSLSQAPYADATHFLFGGNWSIAISIVSFVICVGSLNAWMLTSGQIAFGLAQDRLMPKIFLKQNKNYAPVWGMVISSVGTALLLFVTQNGTIAEQIRVIIDVSVVSFLLVYIICGLGFLKVFWQKKHYLVLGLLGLAFCTWVVCETPWQTLAISFSFTASGVPFYFFWYKKQNL